MLPIEVTHTIKEIIKTRSKLLKKLVLSPEDLETIKAINEYLNQSK